jgi:hypothetical protein
MRRAIARPMPPAPVTTTTSDGVCSVAMAV